MAIGWGVEARPTTKGDYRRLAWRKYGPARGFSAVVNAFLDYMSIGDLVWIRNQRSECYLGKITGDWQYVDADVFKRRDELVCWEAHWRTRTAFLAQFQDLACQAFRRTLFLGPPARSC